MGILDNVTTHPAASSNSRRGTNNEDRPQAKTWLNIGYEKNGKFISLPLGMPVDTMEPAKVNGQDDWQKFQSARNALLKEIQNFADSLEPGAEAELPMLQIRVRRVNEQHEVKPEDNEYSMDFSLKAVG